MKLPSASQRVLGYVAVAAVFVAACAAATFFVMLQQTAEQLALREAEVIKLQKQVADGRTTREQAARALAAAQEKLRSGEADVGPLRDHVEAFAKQAAACASMQPSREAGRKSSRT